MGFLRDVWQVLTAAQSQPSSSPCVDPRQVIADSSPDEIAAGAQQLARYFVDHGLEGRQLVDAMVDASANTGIEVSAIDRAYDDLKSAHDNPVKIATIELASVRVLDLREVSSTRMRIKGSANWVTDDERSQFGGLDYLLVREPDNKFDAAAVAVYGKGRKVGYVSAARAAMLAPIFDLLLFDAFKVTGTSVSDNSIVMWVDVPKIAGLRAFVLTLGVMT